MAPALCGSIVQSRRGMLALGWHFVTLLTIVAFVCASIYAAAGGANDGANNYNNNNNNGDGDEEEVTELSLTSKAMAFASLWTAVLAIGMTVWGTVLLGVQSPTGSYYSCCSGAVHRTTPMAIGAFIGALIVFANLTLVCAVLFGEFRIRDYVGEEERDREQEEQGYYPDYEVERSSTAFSIMCFFMTAMYALYSVLVFVFHESIIAENSADEEEEALQSTNRPGAQFHPAGGGYVGSKFDVHPKTSTVMA